MKQKVRQGDFSCSHLYSTKADGVEKSDIFTRHLSLQPDVKRINFGILPDHRNFGGSDKTDFKKRDPLKLLVSMNYS